MNWPSGTFDWNQARAFLATAEEGSFSGAARALGQAQPTLGRQVAALEESLNVTLFERVGRSLVLTKSGIELLDHVRAMGDAAGRVSLTASGQSQSIEGHVCITASDIMSAYTLPPMVGKLFEIAPKIDVEIFASNSLRDLTRREADIAIRHVRPEQPDLIARLVGEGTARLYAATPYLDRIGRPTSPDELADAVFIGPAKSDTMLVELRKLGFPVRRDNFKLTTGSGIVIWEMVKQGLGVSVLPDDLASQDPRIECVLPTLKPFVFPIWLVTHRELHTSRRIRLVFDLLAESFAAVGATAGDA